MAFQPGAGLYSQGFGTTYENVEVPHIDTRAPSAMDVLYPVGKRWVFVNNSIWNLLGFTSAGGTLTANWVEITDSDGPVLSVTGTANQNTATNTAGNVVLSTPSTFIAPGSIASTTTLTGGTGITATTGNIVASAGNITTTIGSITSATTLTATLGAFTATNGNFVASTLGTGILLNSGTASGTTTATLNGRSGQVTVTTPTIAAGGTITMTISNTSVTASSTQVLYSLVGGTTGAALSIQSVTNSASSSAVVIQNGTGATTNIASLVLTFLVLNA